MQLRNLSDFYNTGNGQQKDPKPVTISKKTWCFLQTFFHIDINTEIACAE